MAKMLAFAIAGCLAAVALAGCSAPTPLVVDTVTPALATVTNQTPTPPTLPNVRSSR